MRSEAPTHSFDKGLKLTAASVERRAPSPVGGLDGARGNAE
jgi:hypothetical protein